MQNFFEEEEASERRQCVVGLGNPGRRYATTRHNVGFNVVASLSLFMRSSMREGRGDFLFSECALERHRFLLATPSTYMNESGTALHQIMEQFNLAVSDLLIVVDDFQLPLGTLRIRENGSDGGHNGLASVVYHLQTENIRRLRVGIAGASCPVEERKELMAAYVLSPFDKGEAQQAAIMITHARDAVLSAITHGIQFAMNNFNRSFLDTDLAL
ncbi:MAG: aminoacyl-tRNA hydrolase [Bacteroidota bacterium]